MQLIGFLQEVVFDIPNSLPNWLFYDNLFEQFYDYTRRFFCQMHFLKLMSQDPDHKQTYLISVKIYQVTLNNRQETMHSR